MAEPEAGEIASTVAGLGVSAPSVASVENAAAPTVVFGQGLRLDGVAIPASAGAAAAPGSAWQSDWSDAVRTFGQPTHYPS
jgi:hypothetical protein